MASRIPSAKIPQIERKILRWKQWVTKLNEHGLQCHYCNTPLTIKTAIQEHMTPICRGGLDHIANIVPSCLQCNQMKAWRTKEEFLRDYDMLLAKRTAYRAIDKPKPARLSFEERNEPGLLKKVVGERESGSWWKRA